MTKLQVIIMCHKIHLINNRGFTLGAFYQSAFSGLLLISGNHDYRGRENNILKYGKIVPSV